ncbi:MAG TPA: hypothetical protein EYM39_06060 [Candidatus Latescibacteria bacterium]|jgi:hypothetical protein|nr:hypothetical protein [Candidatus Latescibacterota bacterium]
MIWSISTLPLSCPNKHGRCPLACWPWPRSLLTDRIETTDIVERLDARIGDRVVCLPTQWLGYSLHHMRFGGSLTATSQTHIHMIVETVDGLLEDPSNRQPESHGECQGGRHEGHRD